MAAYWLTFSTGGPGCIEATSQAEAEALGAKLRGAAVTSCKTLPYPASPRLNAGPCQSFCHDPQRCAGRTACPQRRSCVD